MSVQVYWNPSAEPDIDRYRIERSVTTAVGTFDLLATVNHVIPGPDYDSGEGKFLYVDADGQSSYWYRLIAIDAGDNESVPSAPFQAVSSGTPSSTITPVDIYVTDDTVSLTPLADVSVGIFDSDTLAMVAAAVSDADGRAAFYLLGEATPGITYEVRLFKLGVIFQNPVGIEVIAPLVGDETNRFDVTGTVATRAVATDPDCCRCTGLFVDFSNRPMVGVTVRVSQIVDDPTPKLVNGNGVAAQQMTFRTNSSGYAVFDLLRGGKYYLWTPAEEDTPIHIEVPDRSSVNLIDLMYPYPASNDWDDGEAPGNAVTLAVGEILEVPFTVTLSSFEVKDTSLGQYLDMTIGDSDLVDAAISGDKLVLTGKAAGTTTATPTVVDGWKPERVGSTGFVGTNLGITVTA